MFGNTISMAHKSLDFLWKQQEIINLNIANVNTPGYKRSEERRVGKECRL